MKITIIGLGYVGLSNAALLALKYDVTALDVDEQKIESVNNWIPPFDDAELEELFRGKQALYDITPPYYYWL